MEHISLQLNAVSINTIILIDYIIYLIILISDSEPPGNIHEQTITITTCWLKWSPPYITNGIIMDYKISYSPNGSSSVIQQQIVMNTSIIITDLYPNTSYIINITAINEVGESNPATINITTKPIGQLLLILTTF